MKNEDVMNNGFSDLPKRTIEILRNSPQTLAPLPADDIEQLLHEQIELEIQNNELRKTQAELIRSHEDYSDLYDFAPVSYLTISVKGIIRKLNLTAATMLGKERAYLNKQPLSNFIMPEDMRKYYLYHQKILKTKELQECELRIQRGDGSVFWVHIRCCPVTDESGKVIEIRSVITDIAKRKCAEESREQYMKIIQAQNKELKNVVHVTSHDLNSPLINIVGFSSILADTCVKLRQLLDDTSIEPALKQKLLLIFDEDISEDLAFIKASTDKMGSLLNGLLQVSRSGTVTFNAEHLDMNGMLSDIVKNARFKITECGGTIKVDHLPDCFGDLAMVNQVFSNLIDNAIKYRDPARTLQIYVWGRTENRMSIYCVKDNGVGIDPAHQEKIFEVFHRLNPKDGAGGEGLGLSIVMRIINRLNGQVRVESEEGKGSSFFVSMPTVKLQAES